MIGVWTADKWMGVPWVWWLVGALVAVAGLFGLGNGALNRIYRPVDGLVQGVVGRMGSGKSLFVTQRVLLPFCHTVHKRGWIGSSTQRPMVRVVTNFRFTPDVGVEVRTVQATSDTSIFAAVRDLAWEIGGVEGPWYDGDGILHDGRHPGTGAIREMPDEEPFELEPGKWAYVRQPILNALVVLDELHFFANSNNLALGEEASWLFSMSRKLNAEIWWVSQHEMKVHKRIRDESSSLWLAGKLNGFASWFVGSGWHMAKEYHSPALLERARQSLGTAQAPRCSDKRVYRFNKATKRFYNSFELLVPDPSPRRAREVAKRSGGRESLPVVVEVE